MDNTETEVRALDTTEGQSAEIVALFNGEPPERVRTAVMRMAERQELHHLWAIYDVLRRVPLPLAERLAFVGPRLLFEDDEDQGAGIDAVGELLESIHHSVHSRRKVPIEIALRASYRLLHNRLATWDDATELAAHQLRRPVNKEAWRRRVLRWAERQGLELIRIYRVRDSKSTNELEYEPQ